MFNIGDRKLKEVVFLDTFGVDRIWIDNTNIISDNKLSPTEFMDAKEIQKQLINQGIL